MVYIPPSQSATKKPRARSSAPKPVKYKNKKIEFRGMSFDSIGERDRYIFLLSEQEAGRIRNIQLQVPFKLQCNGQHICKYIADFTYEKKLSVKEIRDNPEFQHIAGGDGQEYFVSVVEDFKGVITDVFALKAKLFKANFGYDITITRRPSWRSSNVLEGKSWKSS